MHDGNESNRPSLDEISKSLAAVRRELEGQAARLSRPRAAAHGDKVRLVILPAVAIWGPSRQRGLSRRQVGPLRGLSRRRGGLGTLVRAVRM